MANKKTTIIAYRGLIELNFYEYSPRARYKRWFLYIPQATGKPGVRNPTLVSGANIAVQAQQRLTWKSREQVRHTVPLDRIATLCTQVSIL